MQSKTIVVTSQQIGILFADLLFKEIGQRKYNKVVDLNTMESRPGICHSHDFCDANMVMHAAFHKVGLAGAADFEENEQESPAHAESVAMWNEAWDYAKQTRLSRPTKQRLTYIDSMETYDSGGHCMIDFVHLKDGKVLGINDECIVLYPSMEAFETHDGTEQLPCINLV